MFNYEYEDHASKRIVIPINICPQNMFNYEYEDHASKPPIVIPINIWQQNMFNYEYEDHAFCEAQNMFNYEYEDHASKPIVIREVWAHNAESEFQLISSLLAHYPYVSMDTEYPGVIHKPKTPIIRNKFPPSELYRLLKANVDELHLIQVGLTFSDAYGNLPGLGCDSQFIWQINLSDFDVEHDPHVPDSIKLLRQNGIDFERNKREGVHSVHLGYLMKEYGLVCNDMVTWVSFQGAYDFGFLIKLLTRKKLPVWVADFLKLKRKYFGNSVYDVKHIMRSCKLYGGLERVAETLNVNREVGKIHLAGSDSLLTWRAFQKLAQLVDVRHESFVGELYGLELERINTE